MQSNYLNNDSGSDSVMAVGMDLFATTFAVFFILVVIAWRFQAGDSIFFKTITVITRVEGQCSFNLVTSISSNKVKVDDYCYSNGDCKDKSQAQSEVVTPLNIDKEVGINLFVANFKIPVNAEELTVESNRYLQTTLDCDEADKNIEMIILYHGKEKIINKQINSFVSEGIKGEIKFENTN